MPGEERRWGYYGPAVITTALTRLRDQQTQRKKERERRERSREEEEIG
jgi:hypothetical protein